MRCSICGRQLKNLQSMELGYGPVCYRRKYGAIPHADGRKRESSAGGNSACEVPGQISMDDYLEMDPGK